MNASPTHAGDGRQRLYDTYLSTHGLGSVVGQTEVTLRRHVLPLLPYERDAQVLDIGCGSGDLVALLGREGYRHVIGVDTSAEQVALAAHRGIAGVRQGDLFEMLQSAEASLDAVIALDVLEHFRPEEAIRVLDYVARALKPGGRFVARTPNAVSPFSGRYRYGDLTHGVSFTTRSLRQALNAAGFSHMAFFPVNPVPHGLRSALRYGLWQAIAALLKVALGAETGQLRGHIVTQNVMTCATR
jgi:2-polyprenyl-3-methyl-5-hydroxy-6-metoxy-1,4-benzoquinol methylase